MDPRSSSLGGGPSPAPGSPKKEISSSCLALFKDAIKRIKNQKQRPGFDRIAQTLKTHHSFSDLHSIKQNLDIAVRDGLLLTVWTKGLQCYKDPDNLRSLRKFTVTSPAETRRAVKAAVREIGDPIGSKLPTIFNYVRYSFTIKVADLEGAIRQAVENLIKKGDLTCNEGDRYRPSHSMAEGGRLQNSASSSLLDAMAEDEDSAMPTSVTTSTPASPIKHNPMSPSKIKG
ncbi:hypothetical protein RvY_18107-1 [Ramazzottius varieornatus]|uniref:SAMD1-like winged helix (WH) domain-containing protein n=1 Tax=Ramazzottius varieornatus TaxID=947166 RepID=A0A1D1W4K3_RAMVA|nr:hypothetical protein RvY_18107-1 [Ramazzottius varieornatus]